MSKMRRLVEFYVLWADHTWSTEAVELWDDEAFMDDGDCVALARARLEAEKREGMVGPLYYCGEPEAATDWPLRS